MPDDNPQIGFSGRRILLVEDELLVALELELILKQLGCEVVGPVPRLEKALPLAREAAIDAAILDVNLRGEQVFPVAEELIRRAVPFVLATGYADLALPEQYRNCPRLQKPYDNQDVLRILNQVLPA